MFPITLESSMIIAFFWKPGVSEKNGTFLYIMGLRSGSLRADLMSAYSL
jgi:hypothetical protein